MAPHIAADIAARAFQEAALVPGRWADALQTVAEACGACIATVVPQEPSVDDLAYSRGGAAEIDQYLHHRRVPDSRQLRVMPRLDEGFRRDHDDYTPRELAHDAYYQEFLRPLGLGWHATTALPGLKGPSYLSLKRRLADGPFADADVALLDRLLPWLRWSARNAALVREARFAGELEAFARLGRGALYVDHEARLLLRNDRVPLGDGLVLQGGRLRAAHTADSRALDHAIGDVAGAGAPGRRPPPQVVVVRRPSGKRPLLLDLMAVSAHDFAAPLRTQLLVVVTDPAAVRLPRPSLLATLFELTPRETDLVLRLAAGDTLMQAAASTRLTVGHARQRLKSVFAKTGTRRQAELMQVLARLP